MIRNFHCYYLSKILTAANLTKIIWSLQAKYMVQLQLKMLNCPQAMVMHVKKISILKVKWKLLNEHSSNRIKYFFLIWKQKLCIVKSTLTFRQFIKSTYFNILIAGWITGYLRRRYMLWQTTKHNNTSKLGVWWNPLFCMTSKFKVSLFTCFWNYRC